MTPYVELNQYEQGNSEDEFYATGSIPSLGNDARTFSSALSNKVQFKVSFPVAARTQMLTNSSSIYYFNANSGVWSIPSKALKDHVGPWSNVSMLTLSNLGSFFIEDTILFDHLGNSLASGSLDIFRATGIATPYVTGKSQKIKEEGDNWSSVETSFNPDGIGAQCTQDYPKSLQRNSDYDSEDGMTFQIPSDKPFLLEKMVFEIPFCFGPGWFNDKTTECFTTSTLGNYTYENPSGNFLPSMNPSGDPGGNKSGDYFDQGGPGITIALFSEKNYGNTKIRDLISRSFFTHKEDVGRNIVFNIYPIQEGTTLLRQRLRSDAVGIDLQLVDSVVTGSSLQNFTGSVIIKSESSVTNGCKFLLRSSRNMAGKTQKQVEDDVYEFLGQEYYTRDSNNVGTEKLIGVDSFGRGMTGFSPSGGSIFGREYTTKESTTLAIKSPFYVKDESERRSLAQDAAQKYVTTSALNLYVDFYGVSYPIGKNPSPYLVQPGENLILTVSKTRPATINFKANVQGDSAYASSGGVPPLPRFTGKGTVVSSSYYHNLKDPRGHDVQFNTGSINITFYGSYVRAGNSYVP